MLRKFLALPTYLVIKAGLRRFPPDHPWRNPPMVWRRWHEGVTRMTLESGLVLWVLILSFVVVVANIVALEMK